MSITIRFLREHGDLRWRVIECVLVKDGICLLGPRLINPKQGIRIFNETEVTKILRKFIDDIFLGCVVRISTVCIEMRVSQRLKT